MSKTFIVIYHIVIDARFGFTSEGMPYFSLKTLTFEK